MSAETRALLVVAVTSAGAVLATLALPWAWTAAGVAAGVLVATATAPKGVRARIVPLAAATAVVAIIGMASEIAPRL